MCIPSFRLCEHLLLLLKTFQTLTSSSAVVSPDAPRRLGGRSGRHHGDLRQVILHHSYIKNVSQSYDEQQTLLEVLLSRYNVHDRRTKSSFWVFSAAEKMFSRDRDVNLSGLRWADGRLSPPAEPLLCCSLWRGDDADGLGSCHEFKLPPLCCTSTGCVVVLPPAVVGVRHCLWVLLGGSSSKGSPGGGGWGGEEGED